VGFGMIRSGLSGGHADFAHRSHSWEGDIAKCCLLLAHPPYSIMMLVLISTDNCHGAEHLWESMFRPLLINEFGPRTRTPCCEHFDFSSAFIPLRSEVSHNKKFMLEDCLYAPAHLDALQVQTNVTFKSGHTMGLKLPMSTMWIRQNIGDLCPFMQTSVSILAHKRTRRI
jgi:hypothetical protein